MIESAAEMLYGLIHVRYILTGRGMAAMVCSRICVIFHFPSLAVLFSWLSKIEFMLNLQLEKFKNYDFGRCPRVHCSSQPCLPVGQSDIPRSSTVKIYCPKCEDIHYPRSKYQGSILLFSHLLNLLIFPVTDIYCLFCEWSHNFQNLQIYFFIFSLTLSGLSNRNIVGSLFHINICKHIRRNVFQHNSNAKPFKLINGI